MGKINQGPPEEGGRRKCLENGLDAVSLWISQMFFPSWSFVNSRLVLFWYPGVDPQKPHPNRILDYGEGGAIPWQPLNKAFFNLSLAYLRLIQPPPHSRLYGSVNNRVCLTFYQSGVPVRTAE